MPKFRIAATALIALVAAFPTRSLEAQSGAGKPVWETLMQKPLPEDSEPKVSVFSIPVGPAPPEPRPLGAGHTHAGPVFAYILQGEIENQVEPDPPEVYKSGGFFYEAPGHVHRFLHNLSKNEPAELIVFQAGDTGQAAPAIKLLLQEGLPTTADQELSLFRLTLPAGARSEARMHSGPGFVYVLEGKIESPTGEPKVYGAGDLFLEPAGQAGLTYRNASDKETAKLLLYQVSKKHGPGAVP
jgi:quercetin dioxygenase-like cupin family protein